MKGRPTKDLITVEIRNSKDSTSMGLVWLYWDSQEAKQGYILYEDWKERYTEYLGDG